MSVRLRSYLLMLAAVIGISAMGSQSAEAASILFGVAGGAGNSTLYQIDQATGAATTVGDIGFAMVGGISFLNGVLYGVTNGNSQLITINTTTGAGTLSKSITNSVAGGPALVASDIAFDSFGTLFAWNETNLPSDRLATIDLGTGVFTNKGASALAGDRDGLAFNGSTLYVKSSNSFFTVNPASGLVDAMNPITSVGGNLFDALALSPAGIGFSVDLSSGGAAVLYRLNAGLTNSTMVGSTGVAGLNSLAFSPDAATAVPEPGSLLLLGTGVTAFVRSRRRRRTA